MTKRFAGQGKNEKVLYVGREHWFSFMQAMGVSIGVATTAAVLIGAGLGYGGSLLQWWSSPAWGALIGGVIGVVCSVVFFVHYYLDSSYIITNTRMRKHVRESIFSHHIKEISLHKIDEVLYTSRGIRSKIRGYGTVNGGSKTEMLIVYFRGVRRGAQVANYLSRLRDYLRERPDAPISDIRPFIPRHKRKKQ